MVVMASSIVSSRFEKVAWPSNREDIDYHDRGQLRLRTLSKDERKRLEAGLRSKGTFTLRRCQMLLASSRGEHVPQIAKNLGCGQQTARDAIHDDFDERGLDALAAKSFRVPKENPGRLR